MNWFQKNFRTLVYCAFLVPILTVALVSISHVTKWYGISNPLSWAIYLSIGVEIAALSALAAISAKMGKKVYFPFAIVTLIQFIGNIFFAYQYIDINSQIFKDWMDLVDPIVSFLGVESGDSIGHKRFLAFFAGGMLPIISLSFLHMLVKFEEEEKEKQESHLKEVVDIDLLSLEAGKKEAEIDKQKYTPTEEDLKRLEEILSHIKTDNQILENEKEKNLEKNGLTELSTEIVDDENLSNETEEIVQNEQILDFIETTKEIEQKEEQKINRLVYTKRDG